VRLSAVIAAVAICASACLPPPPPGDNSNPLPAPSWWSGSCDSGNYAGAHPLGASYRGVEVCGPRPGADGAANRLVRFFPGAWGELEWQCVELSMRFMYVAYGVSPYGANGIDVVDNYSPADGGGLVRIANGTAGTPPVAGDVLSFGATGSSPLGHTGVVESTNVDGNGNGSIRILSQNDTPDGWRTISVSNWSVDGPGGGLGVVAAWLHKPS
jgi:CHAP domain